MIAIKNDYFLQFEKMTRSIIYQTLILPGYYAREDADDLYQDIALDLMNRKEKIVGSYKGLSRFSTFLYRVVIRECCELKRKKIRKEKVEPGDVGFGQVELAKWFGNLRDEELSADTRLILKEFCYRLLDILDTYGSKKQKLVFSLKALVRLLVDLIDLSGYLTTQQDRKIVADSIEKLNSGSVYLTDQEIYTLLTSIFNLLEHKNNSRDAIRKWIDDRLDQIVILMNKPPAKAGFDRETIQLLFEYCSASQINNH